MLDTNSHLDKSPKNWLKRLLADEWAYKNSLCSYSFIKEFTQDLPAAVEQRPAEPI